MKERDTSEEIQKVKAPLRSEITIIRVLIGCGVFSMISFFTWFVQNAQAGFTPLYWLLTLALLFKLAKMAHEWYYYWSPSVPKRPVSSQKWSVDILTTSCPGEPREMIIRTLKAMRNITYPHTDYLCDEGNDPELKKICQELGVVHVTRIEKKDAKAGNINNALRQATGDICLVLDPDHVPRPEFLDRVLPYFENDEIGFVQCVQAYGNQKESFIARGAAEQTYHFYGPMMMTMSTYGHAQAIGANCTFRRKALDSIGGHAAGLAEDMHTSMQLHAKGWKSVYVPEILARGLVPATLSSYYKQQLKWSRGVFELLFRVFPKLYKNFTWRQRIHYFAIPWYFLFGLINLIDILIPLLALTLAQVPWEIELPQFAAYFFPVCGFSLIIRFYVQRWLLEKHERGLHLTGGLLRLATWWVYLIGFIYSILNVNVPYIPTPKEDEHQNYFRLCVPNLAILFISMAGIFYGLYLDWSPYSILMASYSGLIITIFGFTSLMSQQKFLNSAAKFFKRIPAIRIGSSFFETFFQNTQRAVYGFLQNGVAVLIIAVSLAFLSYSNLSDETDDGAYPTKEPGSFYFGTSLPIQFNQSENLNLYSFTQAWGDTGQILSRLNAIHKKGSLPFMNWQIDKSYSQTFYKDILQGKEDSCLEKCAAIFRTYKEPLFISISSYGNSASSAEEFIKAWQYLYTFFNELGISNLTWVWAPKRSEAENFYPGEKFVDWIGVPGLNYGNKPGDKDWYSFSELYKPYRVLLGRYQKPFMITEMGSPTGNHQALWYKQALKDIQNNYKEIKAVLLFTGTKEFTFENSSDTYKTDFSLQKDANACLAEKMAEEPFRNKLSGKENYLDLPLKNYSSSFVKGSPGHFELLVNGKPYYIKGVAYNTAHDWRDGFMPLTRRQVEKDFKKIKDMGANTIRRYDHGIYDQNILNIAKEFDLKVLFGFWFDPKIDYYKDTLRIKKYIAEVEENVIAHKNDDAIIAWSLGNETWGLLKHRFSKPYLTQVRRQYIKLVEYLARRIHELDPTRPVFSCIEHEEYQIAGELVAFRDGAPSIDAIGINSYYKEQISKLDHITWQFDSLRPYLVSEFGPRGYWDPSHNRTLDGSLTEDSENEKANWYKDQWNYYVSAHKGSNIGGFAYCWHDRMEGSCTWFGLTDFKGRLKPAYFALKEVWTGTQEASLPQISIQAPAIYKPDEEALYTLSVQNPTGKTLKYEWYLHKDEYLERVDNIECFDDGRSALVKIPKERSNYRLYVYACDENGNVSTASVPIKVSKKQ